MNKFARIIALSATAVALSSAAAQASLPSAGMTSLIPEDHLMKDVQFVSARPPSGYQGNWYIAPNGCAYSRTQAPGGHATWFLIQNPHHLGLPPKHEGCANTL